MPRAAYDLSPVYVDRVVGAVGALQINGETPMPLDDDRFPVTPGEYLDAVMHGRYLRDFTGGVALAEAIVESQSPIFFVGRRRRFLVNQVVYKDVIIYVIWGYPRQVERYLGVSISMSPKLAKLFQPFLLGWHPLPPGLAYLVQH